MKKLKKKHRKLDMESNQANGSSTQSIFSNISDTLSHSISLLNLKKLAATFPHKALVIAGSLFSKFITGASADESYACFETPDPMNGVESHDNTFICYTSLNNAASIVSSLYNATCGAFPGVDGVDYFGDACARYEVKAIDFGSGLFDGAQCTYFYRDWLDLKNGSAVECVANFFKENVVSGYGTVEDKISVAGIVVGSACLITSCAAGLFYYHRKGRNESVSATPQTPASEKSPLLSVNSSAV